MAAMEKDGQIVPKIKISENKEKITNPGYKKVYRLIENETNKAIADIVMFADETIARADFFDRKESHYLLSV